MIGKKLMLEYMFKMERSIQNSGKSQTQKNLRFAWNLIFGWIFQVFKISMLVSKSFECHRHRCNIATWQNCPCRPYTQCCKNTSMLKKLLNLTEQAIRLHK